MNVCLVSRIGQLTEPWTRATAFYSGAQVIFICSMATGCTLSYSQSLRKSGCWNLRAGVISSNCLLLSLHRWETQSTSVRDLVIHKVTSEPGLESSPRKSNPVQTASLALSRSPRRSCLSHFSSYLEPKRVTIKLRELSPLTTQWYGLRNRS